MILDEIDKSELHSHTIRELQTFGWRNGFLPIREFDTVNLYDHIPVFTPVTDLVWIKDKKIKYAFEIENSFSKRSVNKFWLYSKNVKKYIFKPVDSKKVILCYTDDDNWEEFVGKLHSEGVFLVNFSRMGKIEWSKNQKKLGLHLKKLNEIRGRNDIP